MRYSTAVMSALALASLIACSHASNAQNPSDQSDNGEATNTMASAAATAAATEAAPNANAASGEMTVNTGAGQVTIGAKIDASKLGVPVYPGMSQAGGSTYQVTTANGGAVATYKTDDSFDKVYAFYKSQLPPDAEQMKTPAMAAFSTKSGSDTIAVEILSKAGQSGCEILVTRTPTNSK